MRYFWIFLLICGVCSAETINEKYDKPTNVKYSNQGFPYHDVSFKDIDPKEFNNTIIRGSCFYQEWVEGEVAKDIFPDGMTGVVFDGCNLDNIYVDEIKNTIIKDTITRCNNRKIKVQNDWEDWELNVDLTPKEPLNKEQRLKAGVSIDPKGIPEKKFTKEERENFEKTLNNITAIPIP